MVCSSRLEWYPCACGLLVGREGGEPRESGSCGDRYQAADPRPGLDIPTVEERGGEVGEVGGELGLKPWPRHARVLAQREERTGAERQVAGAEARGHHVGPSEPPGAADPGR